MSRSLRRLVLLSFLLAGIVALTSRQARQAVWGAAPPTRPPARPLDLSKLPQGTIIVIGEDPRDALQQPGVIVLTAEKFKEMLDQIEQLKLKTAAEKPETPGRCKISGRVEGDVVSLTLQYEFETRKRKTLVALGGQKMNGSVAWPTAVTLDDGRLPLMPPAGDDGFVVQVDAPGPHKMTLDVELMVTARGAKGGERGFEIGLPRASITTIDYLDLPEAVREVRSNGRPLAAKELSSRNGQRRPQPLGPADRLDVAWKGPAPPPAQALQTAQATIDVHVDEAQVTIQAELTLQMKSGQTAVWQIQAPPPPQATVDPDVPASDPRGVTVTAPAVDARVPVWTIKLKEPSDEPLKVRVRLRQPRAGKTVTVTPFPVIGAVHQNGTIIVTVPPELRYRARTRGEVSQREVPEELRRAAGNIAVFGYWNLPAARNDQPAAAALELDVEMVKGGVEVETAYQLRLTEQGWQVAAALDVTPVRAVVERLEVELPADGDFKAGPALLAEPDMEIKEVGGKRIGVIKLVGKQSRPFKLTVEGVAPAAKGAVAAVVALPRPQQVIDKGAKLTLALPESAELLAVREPGDGPLPLDRRDRPWRFERTPARIELTWRERRSELSVETVADVTLADRQAQVRQRLRFPALLEGLKEIALRAPDLPAGRTPFVDGQPLTAGAPGVWLAPVKAAGIVVEYSFPLPAPEKNGRGKHFALPLFWPEGTTRCATKVRLWSDPGTQPRLAGGPWEELPAEAVAERDTLPALVLRGGGVETPLLLRLATPTGVALSGVSVDRVLIQAAIIEGEQQTYRARFLLGKVAARHIDIELPAPLAALNLEVLLDGLRLTNLQAVDEDGAEAETGRIARVHVEPELYHKPVVLDVRYQIGPGRGDGQGRLCATLVPPRLRGAVLLGRVRWLVALPPEWVAFCPDVRVAVEQGWGWRGNLPAPRPAASAVDLEHWFQADRRDEPGGSLSAADVELVAAQATPAPLAVWHVAQQTWLLGCSLAVLALGLGLYFAAWPRGLFWAALLGLGLGLLAVGLFWPGVLPWLAYGCEPGAVVLLLVIGVQWFLQRRYRRQVVFMPGFSRLAPGSSILRGNGASSSHRRRGEPSTVDVPPAAGH